MPVIMTPLSCASAIVHRIALGRWPRSGYVCVRRDGALLTGRRCDLIDLLALAEPRTYRFLLRLCRKLGRGTFLDVGSCVGMYTVAIAKLGFNVFAVEPSPDTFAILNKNIKINGLESKVTLINAALADKDGEKFFYLSRQHAGQDSLFRPREYLGKLRVRTISLQSLLSRIEQPVDIIKVDAEGSEKYILENIRMSPVEQIKRWIIEIPDEHLDDAIKTFRIAGYKCMLIEKLIRGQAFNLYAYK